MNAAEYIALFDTLSPADKAQVASHFDELGLRLKARLKFASVAEAEAITHEVFARNESLFRRLAASERDGMDDALSSIRG